MEKKKKKKVYCRGTDSGWGVIKALESYGGVNSLNLDGTDITKIYYISPMNDEIHSVEETEEKIFDNETIIRILYETNLYTEVNPDRTYYTIVINYGSAIVVKCSTISLCSVESQMNLGNRYATKEEAQADADRINNLFKCNLLNKAEDDEDKKEPMPEDKYVSDRYCTDYSSVCITNDDLVWHDISKGDYPAEGERIIAYDGSNWLYECTVTKVANDDHRFMINDNHGNIFQIDSYKFWIQNTLPEIRNENQ